VLTPAFSLARVVFLDSACSSVCSNLAFLYFQTSEYKTSLSFRVLNGHWFVPTADLSLSGVDLYKSRQRPGPGPVAQCTAEKDSLRAPSSYRYLIGFARSTWERRQSGAVRSSGRERALCHSGWGNEVDAPDSEGTIICISAVRRASKNNGQGQTPGAAHLD